MGDKIYLLKPNVGKEEEDAVAKGLSNGWVAPEGPELNSFEVLLESYFKDRKVLLVNSGTAALHLSLILADVSKGDHVLTSTLTFAACANVILYQHAVPVFLDSEDKTWNLDPDLLESYLKKNKKKPKAIILTHLYGMPAQIKQIKKLCDQHEIALIEDAAESFGAKYDGEYLGMHGKFGIISFNGNKIITTSGGGALICDKRGYDRAKYLSSQANSGIFEYHHDAIGYNYRLSNILACIGMAQLSKLEKFILIKRDIYECYVTELSSYFEFLPEMPGSFSNRWLSVGLLKDTAINPLKLIQFLADKNIETRRVWKPLHLHRPYQAYPLVDTGVAINLFDRGICFPSGTNLLPREQEQIIELVKQFFNMLKPS